MRLIEQLFSIIAPSSCMGCSREGSLLCRWCTEDTLPLSNARCYRCNALSPYFKTCRACRRSSVLSQVWVLTEYDGIAKELVHRMKFKYSREAANIIAQEMAVLLPALPPDTVFIHIPTITSHVRQRGMDHAKLIASELSRISGYGHLPALVRVGQHRQVGSLRHERMTGVQDSFRVSSLFSVKNVPVVLVDDVVTTGATIETAAKVLKAAGARSVSAIVFARAR